MKLLLLLLTLSAHAAPLDLKQKIVQACEDESCCTKSKVTDRAVTLYKVHNKKSPLLGNFKPATPATALEAFTIIVVPELARVTLVKSKTKKFPLRKGDELSSVFSHGNGYFSALLKGRQINYSEKEVETKTLRRGRHEVWTKLRIGKIEGYTPGFPFFECLD